MSASPNLKLPYIDANQNQKTVTHNAALRALDALVNLHVAATTLQTPPATVNDGQCWIVAPGGSGAWLGKDLNVAAWQDGAWTFYPPNPGFVAYVDAIQGALMWNGTAWVSLIGAITSLGLAALGIGTAADAGNPLSAKLNAALFAALPTTASPAGTGDVRLKLSKQAAGNTASFLFQDNYSGRAEIGLAGDDNFHFKVSADGSTFRDALVLNASTGDTSLLSLNGGPLAGRRNRVINGNFAINQRALASGTALAAGAYGHDRWKAGASGATYTFAAAKPDTLITITAGTLQQVIDDANVEGGTYTLSWTGTATARVYQGSATGAYLSSPLTVTGLSAGTVTTIEFSTGTLGQVQFEPGSKNTPFERWPIGIELQLCLRYFWGLTWNNQLYAAATVVGQASSATAATFHVQFPVRMRAIPTLTVSNVGDFAISSSVSGAIVCTSFGILRGGQDIIQLSIGVASGLTAGNATFGYVNSTGTPYIFFSAEL